MAIYHKYERCLASYSACTVSPMVSLEVLRIFVYMQNWVIKLGRITTLVVQIMDLLQYHTHTRSSFGQDLYIQKFHTDLASPEYLYNVVYTMLPERFSTVSLFTGSQIFHSQGQMLYQLKVLWASPKNAMSCYPYTQHILSEYKAAHQETLLTVKCTVSSQSIGT